MKGVTITPNSAKKALDIRAGDTVKVWQKIKEGKEGEGKIRLQLFEGLVLAHRHGGEAGGTFTVRRIASGVGVERIFPVHSPMIDSVEIVKRAKVRRAKLYHIRRKAAKEISREMRNLRSIKEEPAEAAAAPAAAAEAPKADAAK